MTDNERDPEAPGPDGATDDTEDADDAALDTDAATEADEAEDEGVDAAADVAPAAAAAAGKASRGPRDRRPKTTPAAAPSVSDQAVHINDRASAVFVLASIGVFVAIFAWALLFGQGGFVTNVMATPTPAPTATPAPTPTPAATPTPAPRRHRPPGRRRRRVHRPRRRRRLAGPERIGRPERLGRPQRLGPQRRFAEPGGELGRQGPRAMDEARGRASEARARMVADQLLARDIRDERVLAAMDAVPRELFVPERERDLAYRDGPLPIAAGQTISQPYIVARMVELLHVGPGDRVLEVGTGSGYAAAVLAELGCGVTTIERDPARGRRAPPPGGPRLRGSRGRAQGRREPGPAPGAVGRHRGGGRRSRGAGRAPRAAGRWAAPGDPVGPGEAAAHGGGAARGRVAGDLGRGRGVRAAHRRRGLVGGNRTVVGDPADGSAGGSPSENGAVRRRQAPSSAAGTTAIPSRRR